MPYVVWTTIKSLNSEGDAKNCFRAAVNGKAASDHHNDEDNVNVRARTGAARTGAPRTKAPGDKNPRFLTLYS